MCFFFFFFFVFFFFFSSCLLVFRDYSFGLNELISFASPLSSSPFLTIYIRSNCEFIMETCM